MKKVLKTGAKIFGIAVGSVSGILVLLCAVTPGWGVAQITRGTVTEAMPQTPSDFTPAIRLIVFTDTHNKNENVADAIDTAYALFDNDGVYPGVDAFFGLGDFSNIGTEPVMRLMFSGFIDSQ